MDVIALRTRRGVRAQAAITRSLSENDLSRPCKVVLRRLTAQYIDEFRNESALRENIENIENDDFIENDVIGVLPSPNDDLIESIENIENDDFSENGVIGVLHASSHNGQNDNIENVIENNGLIGVLHAPSHNGDFNENGVTGVLHAPSNNEVLPEPSQHIDEDVTENGVSGVLHAPNEVLPEPSQHDIDEDVTENNVVDDLPGANRNDIPYEMCMGSAINTEYLYTPDDQQLYIKNNKTSKVLYFKCRLYKHENCKARVCKNLSNNSLYRTKNSPQHSHPNQEAFYRANLCKAAMKTDAVSVPQNFARNKLIWLQYFSGFFLFFV